MSDRDLPAPHSLEQLSISVPDLNTARRFYSSFGLEVSGEECLSVATAGSAHAWLLVNQSVRPDLQKITLGCFQADLDALFAKLKAANAGELTRVNGLICFRDMDGTSISLSATVQPSRSVPVISASIGGERRAAVSRSHAPRIRPTALGHVLLFTPDVDRAVRFYCEALGFRLSDRSGADVAFLHLPHGSSHHVLAFGRGERAGLHHLAWDVPDFESVGLGAMQMAAAGYEQGWGVGRHVLGSNYFCYVADPWGSYSEYSAAMDYIPSGMIWQAGDHPAEDAFYLWGPAPPALFHIQR